MNIYLIFSILGALIAILTYLFLQLEKLNSKSISYSLWNLISAVFIGISLIKYWNLGSFIIEIFWFSISLYGLLKAIKNKY